MTQASATPTRAGTVTPASRASAKEVITSRPTAFGYNPTLGGQSSQYTDMRLMKETSCCARRAIEESGLLGSFKAVQSVRSNTAARMLQKAAKAQYSIPAVCVYNIEGIMATVHAATSKKSPAMLLLFPWAQSYSGSVLARAAAEAAKTASVPITVHLDHAQTPEAVKEAADMGCYDSIMVDMSHYEHEQNLGLTKELAAYCHERGILVEAECGRIEGGEDGVSDTADLQAVMTTPEQAKEFVDTGIDWLAPAFGNVHGKYGPRGIQLDYERLRKIKDVVGDTSLVLHGTDAFDEKIYRECIEAGITKCNINRVVNERLTGLWKESDKGLTGVMEDGTKAMQDAIQTLMDWLGSTGKA